MSSCITHDGDAILSQKKCYLTLEATEAATNESALKYYSNFSGVRH